MKKHFLKNLVKKRFNLSNFKKPFCSKEKKRFKRYETVNFKTDFFKKSYKDFCKNKKILIISGPARNGNHALMSMLDGHPEISFLPGEDFLLREFFSRAKENEKKIIRKIKNLDDVEYLTKMSGAYQDKWRLSYESYIKKTTPKYWSGQQPENKTHINDYQDIVPKTNYKNYKNFLKNKIQDIRNSKSFLEFFDIYLNALNKLVPQKKNLKYGHIYVYSGLRRELFYLLEKTKNIICLCPIRRFETFYYSYAKSRFFTEEVRKKALNELWEHWRHKTIDYLLLQKKYPKKIFFVRFEDLLKNPEILAKKLCKKLGIKFNNKLKIPTLLEKKVKGNSSFKKSDKYKGKFYQEPLENQIKFPKELLPDEYFEIYAEVNKKCV